MVEQYDLEELTARLGAPHLEQMTVRSGEASQMLVHWGCGCTAMRGANEQTGVRWSRCGHHAAAAAVLP